MLRKILIPLLAAMTLAACGGVDSSIAMSGSPGVDNGTADGPARIVSISTVATEMLFAIGAGDQVVAVDSLSTFPADAPVTDLSGFEPNIEAILGFRPDLVVLSYDPGDVVAGLEAAGVESMLQGASMTIADTYSQILALGEITAHAAEATALVEAMRAEITDLAASVTGREEPLTYYHELDDTLYTVTSSTFIGEVYALAGLVNAADPADADGSLRPMHAQKSTSARTTPPSRRHTGRPAFFPTRSHRAISTPDIGPRPIPASSMAVVAASMSAA